MGINVQQGTVNTLALVVAGLYIGIVPPAPTTLNATPANIAAFVGNASYGPVNTPMPWQDYGSFSSVFGPLVNRVGDLGTAVSIAVQQGANNGYAVRVTDGTDTAALGKFGISASIYAVLLTARYSGSSGNSFTATIGASAYPNAMKLTLTSGIGAPEVFDGLSTSSPAVFWAAMVAAVNAGTNATRPKSNYFLATIGTNTTASIPAAGTVLTLAGGTDGVTFSTVSTTVGTSQGSVSATVTLTSGTGVAVGQPIYATGVPLGTKVLSITGTTLVMTQPSTVVLVSTTAISFGQSYPQAAVGFDGVAGTRTGMYALRGTGASIAALVDVYDSFTFATGTAPTLSGIDTWAAQAAFGLSERIYMISCAAAGDSPTNWLGYNAPAIVGASGFYSLKVMFGDWPSWSDTINGVVRMVSPPAYVVGRLANQSPALSALNQPIYGVAGSQFSNSGLVYGNLDIATIQSAGFDVIVPPGQGPGGEQIWTCATGNSSNYLPGAQGDNYTTMTNYIVSGLAQVGGLGIFIGQIITPALSGQIIGLLRSWFNSMWRAGLIGNYQGTIPYQVTNTSSPTQQQNGITVLSVKVQYGPILRELALNFQGGQTVQIINQSNGYGL